MLTGSMAGENYDDTVTEAVEVELEEITRSVAATDTGAVVFWSGGITDSIIVIEDMSDGAAVLARAAWCWAARWQFFSFSDGPR